jgi:exopolyphosphatase/guanosine-5'-triphosphate,3'-diphosphate pyrophosphatase
MTSKTSDSKASAPRYAALDIGSNSVHMIIVETDGRGGLRVIDREREMLKLGSGTFTTHRIRDDRYAETLQVLGHFATLARRHEVSEILAVATSAVREAENGPQLLAEIRAQTGIDVRLIEGQEEARLIWRGVTHSVDLRKRRGLIIDVGGGSVELIVGDARSVQVMDSLPLGVQRLKDFFGTSDPLQGTTRDELVRHVTLAASAAIAKAQRAGFEVTILTSGTLLALGLAAIRARGADPWAALDGQVVSARELKDLSNQLLAMDQTERLRVPGIDERRADTMHLASALIVTLLDLLKVEQVLLSNATLRQGLVLDRLALAGEPPPLDIRRDSIGELLATLSGAAFSDGAASDRGAATSERRHGEHVAALAVQLFDLTATAHKLGALERELCGYAAQLSDIGRNINYMGHEHLAYHLTRGAGLRGFTTREVDIMGLAARYHRKGNPKPRHHHYAELDPNDRQTVKVIAGIIRIADALDRGRTGVVTRVTGNVGRRKIELEAESQTDVSLEVWAANRQTQLLGRAIDREISVTRARSTT